MILTSYFSSGRMVKCGGTRRTDNDDNDDFYKIIIMFFLSLMTMMTVRNHVHKLKSSLGMKIN